MNIIVFTYDFPHQKSCNGLLALYLAGYKNVRCIAAPKKVLDIIPSFKRITPIIEPYHPQDLAEAFGYEFIQFDHDLHTVTDLMNGFDAGVILGARILKPFVVEMLPIINTHPGALPANRGLDNIKWAVINNIPQAVTSHIVDEDIDCGYLIERKIIDVFEDDTLMDIFIRMQNQESYMMIDALNRLNQKEVFTKKLYKGPYYRPVPDWLDVMIDVYFDNYRHHYGEICDSFFEKEKIT